MHYSMGDLSDLSFPDNVYTWHIVNPLPTYDAPMRHDLSEISIRLW